MEEKIEGQSFVMPRLGLGEQLLSEYEIEIEGVAKGRGSLLVFSGGKTYMLKMFQGSKDKAGELAVVLKQLADWDETVEQILPTKEGDFLVREEGGPAYILKSFKNGRECDIKNPLEMLEGARKLADLHMAFNEMVHPKTELFQTPEHSLPQELYRHNREMRNLRNYIRKKKSKNSFEEAYQNAYGVFYSQAEKIEREILQESISGEEKQWGFCHGDYHYHNLVDCDSRSRVLHFENMRWDSQVSDLAKYLRKLLEKNRWNPDLGLDVISTYERVLPLGDEKRRELYLRMAYPEKFWKIANHYNNNKKAWASKRDGEKLQQVIAQERDRQTFLELLYNQNE